MRTVRRRGAGERPETRDGRDPRGDEQGFTFVELLAVVLLLGILVLVALPNYFGAETEARRAADRANLRAINAALALYRYRNSGTCPTVDAFPAFLSNPLYLPDGAPLDPWTNPPSGEPYTDTYSAALCRVQESVAGPPAINHNTGAGH